jgi:hypothetical protein
MANEQKFTPGQKRSRIENEFKRKVTGMLQELGVEDYKVNPSLPKVLIQPSILIVPELGSLICLEIAYIHPEQRLWDFSLEKIEQLFELKLALPEGTSHFLTIIQDMDDVAERGFEDDPNQENYLRGRFLQFSDAIELLNRFFDGITTIHYRNGEFDINVREYIHGLLHTDPKDNLRYLWEMEQEARSRNYDRIRENPSVRMLIEATIEPNGRRQPFSRNLKDLRELCLNRLRNNNYFPGYQVSVKPRVFNIKEFFLNSGTSYFFTFDFVLTPRGFDTYEPEMYGWRPQHFTRLSERGGAFVEVLRGSSKEFGQIRRLQRIATRARFIGYVPDEETERIRALEHAPNLILVLDGSLLGPQYDPKRYLRLLIASGWTPIYLQNLSEHALNML